MGLKLDSNGTGTSLVNRLRLHHILGTELSVMRSGIVKACDGGRVWPCVAMSRWRHSALDKEQSAHSLYCTEGAVTWKQ